MSLGLKVVFGVSAFFGVMGFIGAGFSGAVLMALITGGLALGFAKDWR